MPIPTLGQPGFGMDFKNRFRGAAFNNPQIQNFPTPLTVATFGITLTAQQCINGIVVLGVANTSTVTLPSAANLRTGLMPYMDLQGAQVGDTVPVLICNGGTGSMGLVGGVGGSADVNGNSSILTGQSKYVLMRFSNVTPGSEAYTFFT